MAVSQAPNPKLTGLQATVTGCAYSLAQAIAGPRTLTHGQKPPPAGAPHTDLLTG